MKTPEKNRTKADLLKEISSLKLKIKSLENKINIMESSVEHNRIASTVTDGIFVYSEKGFQSVNESLANMLGYSVNEFLKKTIGELIAPADRKLVIERAEQRLAGKIVPSNYDVILLHKDGETHIPVNFNLSLTETRKGTVIIGIVKDNSEKERVNKELEEFKDRFNAITSYAGDAIIIVNEDLSISYWNKASEKIFGYSFDFTRNKNLITQIFKENNEEFITEIAACTQKLKNKDDSASVFETSLNHKNGSTVSVEVSVSPIKSEDEQHLIFVIRDVTERVEKDKLLSEERKLTQYFMDYIPFSIYFKDLESRFIKVNKATVNKLGFTESNQLIGKTDFDVFGEEHALAARQDELKLINRQEEIINKVEKETWKNGKIQWVSTTKFPLRNQSGNIIGTLGITRDFTEVKKSQLIQQTLLQISTAVNNVEEMDDLYYEIHQAVSNLMKADNFYIALYDEESKILSFPYFVDEYDPKPESRIAGRGLTEYILRSGKAHLIDTELDLALRKLDETSLLGESSKIWLGVPLNIGDRTIGAIVVQDYNNDDTYGEEELQILTYVSEQIANAIMKKNAERQLKKFSRELQEMNASKDKFFSIIAHDLKSPFQGLLGLSRLIVEEYAELSPEELKSFVLALNESAESTYGLIENLLEWSRLQTGRMKFNPSIISVTDIIEEIKMLLYHTAEMKNIKIKNEITKETNIWGDKYMIGSLFQNIISNAIKFTNKFGEICVKSVRGNDFVEFYVIDNGVGIEPEDIEKLLSIDTTYTTRGTEQERGTGLGLILCKEIINRHGGTIRIESEKGMGTTVIFSLKINETLNS
ncbi:MAG: PAS domain S-box protein [Ignavibacteriaceae bacterium]